MSLSTTARPYAQALFDHSEGWTEDLEQIVSAMSDAAVGLLIASPDKAYKEKTEIFVNLFDGEVQQKTINFLKVLGEAKRLSLLPNINTEYKKLLAERDSSSELTITSAYELTKEQMDSMYEELQMPITVAILYFLFQLLMDNSPILYHITKNLILH